MKIGEYELRTDGFSDRKDIVYRTLGTKTCSVPVCRIYGDTDAIRERIFIRLFTPTIKYDSKYTPLAHASVLPIDIDSDLYVSSKMYDYKSKRSITHKSSKPVILKEGSVYKYWTE